VQTQIYTGSATPLCLRPVSKQPAWEFHYLVKSLYKFWTTQGQPFLCVQISLQQETLGLLIPFWELEWREEEISLKRDRLNNLSTQIISYWIASVLAKES